jgi:hypothetical protein
LLLLLPVREIWQSGNCDCAPDSFDNNRPRFDYISKQSQEEPAVDNASLCRVVAPASSVGFHFSNLLLVSSALSDSFLVLSSTFSCRASAMMSTTTTPTHNDDDPIRTKQLQDLWSTSFDPWIDVPHHDEPIVYLRPQPQDNDDDDSNTSCQSTTTRAVPQQRLLPTICHQVSMFALTGYNPMRQDRPTAPNVAATRTPGR